MYDTFSSDYDRFVNWPGRLAAELPFLQEQLQTLGPSPASIRVLDAAAGTGMHAIALARQGYRVVGADLSGGMVERARANARQAGFPRQAGEEEITFVVAGFGALHQALGDEAFDAVLCLGNSLPHVADPREMLAALRDFAAVLRPGGLLLVQNRNFDAVLAARERWMEPQGAGPQGAEPQGAEDGQSQWVFVRFYDFLADGGIDFNVVTLRRDGAGPWQQSVTRTRLYPLREGELTGTLNEAGFVEAALYGNMAGAPFDAEKSGNLVVVARRK